jgi:hypothetical protein
LAPRELAPPVHSLPPILDNESQTSTQSCSKGSRGLSVQPRVLGIFTETTISPDPSLRQRPSRYAIRAGRNFAFLLRFRRRRLSLHPGSPRGRRVIASADSPYGGGCDLASSGDAQSLRGQAPKSRLPTGSPSRCHGVLEAPHTRRASPLLAGLSSGITSEPGNSDWITRQGISLP